MDYSDAIPSYPVKVLNYAFKHDFNDLADKAAHTALSLPLGDIATTLAPGVMQAWVRDTSYHGSYVHEIISTRCNTMGDG